MQYLVSFAILFSISFTYAEEGFDEYKHKVEVPEPLFIDLVRSLNAKYGEWEVNSLVYHSSGNFQHTRWAPEVEYVLKSGTAMELEFPMEGDKLINYKLALQQRIFSNHEGSHLHGLQFIYEADPGFLHTDATLYYIVAHRFNHHLSTIGLYGVRTFLEAYEGTEISLNQSIFVNYSRQIDLGVEVNYSSGEIFSRFLQVVPQLHLAFKEGAKIQFGFGMRNEQSHYRPISTFRLIWELNKE